MLGVYLASCSTTGSSPKYPIAGRKVAEELQSVCAFPQDSEFWKWMGRLEKFKRQTEVK